MDIKIQEDVESPAFRCALYFRNNSGWDRIFRLMKKKWESLGRPAGTILLRQPTDEECRAVSGFLGKRYSGEELRFKVEDFANALEMTVFRGVEYKTLLDMYFGQVISTKASQRQEQEEHKEAFYRRLKADIREDRDTSLGESWIEAVCMEQKYGYMQMEQLRKTEDYASVLRVVKSICDAYEEAQRSDSIPLAIVAALVSGNPHYLDRGTVPGNLFVGLCCYCKRREFPGDAKRWKSLLSSVHIVPDEVASTVMTYGLHLQEKEGVLHPGAELFCQMREPLILSSLNLQRLSGAYSEDGNVWVVENEMVFTFLLTRMLEKEGTPTALLCTSGQLRTAAWELLELLVQADMKIHYSGDLDPEGMAIADRIQRTYPNHVTLWHMSEEDYLNSVSEEGLEEWRLKKMENLHTPVLQATAALLRIHKKAGYQENLLLNTSEEWVL